jgi:hypothetical protein
MRSFALEAYQNEFLPIDGSEVNAVVTVTADMGEAGPDAAGGAAEIVVVDMSGSMEERAKLLAAREATAVAVECIRDGVEFAVIAGSKSARPVYPPKGGLAVASGVTREEACRAARRLSAGGGTAMSTWLSMARDTFATSSAAIRHSILLTDGRNETDEPGALESVLADCQGSFQCDCRGVGTDWEVDELRRIATALLGSVDIVAEPEGLVADFRSLIEGAMGKGAADVSLRLWTPLGARTAFVRQVAPAIEDLTVRAVPVDDRSADYPTGSWGSESRDYHLCIRVEPRAAGEEMLAGRVSLVVDGEISGQALVRAVWTDDPQLSTRINREVAHYSGQEELAEAIQEGLEARKAGDERTATARLGRAVQLAAESGNEPTMGLLRRVVEVEDPGTGTVRLRRDVAEADEMSLDTRSTKTVRVERPNA